MKLFRLLGVCLPLVIVSVGSASAGEEYIFSAPPRGSLESETKVYAPIALYLSEVTGKKIVYKHPGDWLTYQRNMQRGIYDLVFDGPHFVAWRMAMVHHRPLVKLPGKLAFIVFVKTDNDKIKTLEDLRGRTVCGLAPPNLATLTMYDQFRNPMRQPLVVEVKSFPLAYKGVMEARCVAGVMRDKMFSKLDKQTNGGKIIFHSQGVANQAFSAGPRFSDEDTRKISTALLSEEGKQRMTAFHKRFNRNAKPLQPAGQEEYAGLWRLLQDVWGFNVASKN